MLDCSGSMGDKSGELGKCIGDEMKENGGDSCALCFDEHVEWKSPEEMMQAKHRGMTDIIKPWVEIQKLLKLPKYSILKQLRLVFFSDGEHNWNKPYSPEGKVSSFKEQAMSVVSPLYVIDTEGNKVYVDIDFFCMGVGTRFPTKDVFSNLFKCLGCKTPKAQVLTLWIDNTENAMSAFAQLKTIIDDFDENSKKRDMDSIKNANAIIGQIACEIELGVLLEPDFDAFYAKKKLEIKALLDFYKQQPFNRQQDKDTLSKLFGLSERLNQIREDEAVGQSWKTKTDSDLAKDLVDNTSGRFLLKAKRTKGVSLTQHKQELLKYIRDNDHQEGQYGFIRLKNELILGETDSIDAGKTWGDVYRLLFFGNGWTCSMVGIEAPKSVAMNPFAIKITGVYKDTTTILAFLNGSKSEVLRTRFDSLEDEWSYDEMMERLIAFLQEQEQEQEQKHIMLIPNDIGTNLFWQSPAGKSFLTFTATGLLEICDPEIIPAMAASLLMHTIGETEKSTVHLEQLLVASQSSSPYWRSRQVLSGEKPFSAFKTQTQVGEYPDGNPKYAKCARIAKALLLLHDHFSAQACDKEVLIKAVIIEWFRRNITEVMACITLDSVAVSQKIQDRIMSPPILAKIFAESQDLSDAKKRFGKTLKAELSPESVGEIIKIDYDQLLEQSIKDYGTTLLSVILFAKERGVTIDLGMLKDCIIISSSPPTNVSSCQLEVTEADKVNALA